MPENKEEWVDCVAIEAMKAFIVTMNPLRLSAKDPMGNFTPDTFANICYGYAEAMYKRSLEIK